MLAKIGSKKASSSIFAQIFIGILALFVIIIAVRAAYLGSTEGGFSEAISNAIDEVSGVFYDILGPLFNSLLGIDKDADSNVNFLIILVFIMVLIIITGTLDSVNIFGGSSSGQSKILKFLIGLIVSIIGVRFMPEDMWESLTAPSTALIATMLMGLPFLALMFITMKFTSTWVRKAFWIFYVVFVTYTIVGGDNFAFKGIYIIFLVLAGIMTLFDNSVRLWFYKEKGRLTVNANTHHMMTKAREDLQAELNEWLKISTNPSSSAEDREEADTEIQKIRKLIEKTFTEKA